MNDRNNTNARFIQVKQLPQINSHLTAKLYVGNSIDEPSLVGNYQYNDFNNNNLTNTNSITLNARAVKDNQVITKVYVDQFHQENEQSRRDLGIDLYDESNDLIKNNQDNDFNENKLIIKDSITINRNPTADNEVSNKKYIDDELDKNTIVRFNQTLQNHLKASVGNDIYNITKYNKINITHTAEIRNPNTGQMLLQKWIMKCLNKSYIAKTNTFLKSTTNISPTAENWASSLSPIGWVFMNVEMSGSNH